MLELTGDDIPFGGAGNDVLFGGDGFDAFFFSSAVDMIKGGLFDLIQDFSQAGGDIIDLLALGVPDKRRPAHQDHVAQNCAAVVGQ